MCLQFLNSAVIANSKLDYWTVYFVRAVFRFRFIACIDLYSNTKLWWAFYLPPFAFFTKLGFFWQPCSEKRLPTCFVWSARTTKFFVLFCFLSWRMQTLPRARNVWRLNSQISHGTCVHYPFFVLNIPLCNFSYRNFFPLFVCFDILWQLATIHKRDNTCGRNANRSHQNDVTWCDFLQRKQVELSLSRSLLSQKT